jgi:hypothetical protein
MNLSPNQLDELLEVIDFNTVIFGAFYLGDSVLSNDDKELLRKYGIDIEKLAEHSYNYPETAFKFGMLTQALKKQDIDKIKYEDFKKFIKEGKYLPLTDKEKYTLDILQKKTFSHIKDLSSKIKSQTKVELFNQTANHRKQYEKLIKEELIEGVTGRKSIAQIVSNLGHKTGDWQRNFGRIVETEMHTIFEEGRAAEIEREKGKDALVYKDVFLGACKYCIKHYLTNGTNSPAKIFKLSQLLVNGTNIGKKADKWLPVVGAMHPFCRCLLNDVPDNPIWDKDKREYKEDKTKFIPKVKVKSTISVKIGDKEFEV